MKYILLFSIFASINAFGQFSTSIIDANNASAVVNDDGVLFQNTSALAGGYEIPKGSGNTAIYSSGFWFGGIDQNAQLHLSATRYSGGEDIFPGPIADPGMYSSPDYIAAYSNSIWSVKKSEIDDHILNWNQPNYVIPSSILNWPGNGDPLLGVAQQLAPYFDVNFNGMYEPSLGDYPNIRGDEAHYVIMNDAAEVHTGSGGDALGIEVHLMIYQMSTTGYIDNTTFINARVFNRSNTGYSDFRTSYYVDGDIGSGQDDYVGSDSLRNMIFTYNGDLNDPQYGANPPGIGVVSLSDVMSGAGYFTNTAPATQSDPSSAAQYWNYMNNKWRFGDPWVYGGTGFAGSVGATNSPTGYLFNSNSSSGFDWDESTNNNPAGDRRMFMNLESISLMPGEFHCYDFAVIFGEGGPSLFSSVVNLENHADQVQPFFDSQVYSCETVTVGNDELSSLEASIYPNPSEGEIAISFKESIDEFAVNVTDLSGKSVFSETYMNESQIVLNLTEAQGVYLVRIETEKGTMTERIVLR